MFREKELETIEDLQKQIIKMRKNQILGHASGEIISINDSAEDICNLELCGNTKQNIRQGYNLLNLDGVIKTLGGITITKNNDGSITLNGTATNITDFYIYGNYGSTQEVFEEDEYTIEISSNDDSKVVPILCLNGTNVLAYMRGSKTFRSAITAVAIRVEANQTLTNLIVYPQLVKGTVTKPFEAYGTMPSIEFPSLIECVETTNKASLEMVDNFVQKMRNAGVTNGECNIITENNQKVLRLQANAGYNKENYNEIRKIFYGIFKENTQYTIKFDFMVNIAGEGTNFRIKYTDGTTQGINKVHEANTLTSITITSKSAKTIDSIECAYYDGITRLYLNTLMIYEGTEDKEYQPYGIMNVKIQNKNLFDKNKIKKLNGYIANAPNFISSATAKTLYISCKPNTPYTISKIASTRFRVATNENIPQNESLLNKKAENDTAKKLTIISGNNDKYLLVYYYSSSSDTLTEQQILDSIQIEEGTEATEYIEHQEQNYPIRIGDMKLYGNETARDKIIRKDNKWYVLRNYGRKVFIGADDESWGAAGSGKVKRFTVRVENIKRTSVNTEVANLISNYFPTTSVLSIYNGNQGIGITFNDDMIWVDDAVGTEIDQMNASQFKAWLSTHNLEVVYKLKNPVLEEIIDQDLITDLDFLYKNIESYNNNTNINSDSIIYLDCTYVVSNVIMEMQQNKRIEELERIVLNQGGI